MVISLDEDIYITLCTVSSSTNSSIPYIHPYLLVTTDLIPPLFPASPSSHIINPTYYGVLPPTTPRPDQNQSRKEIKKNAHPKTRSLPIPHSHRPPHHPLRPRTHNPPRRLPRRAPDPIPRSLFRRIPAHLLIRDKCRLPRAVRKGPVPGILQLGCRFGGYAGGGGGGVGAAAVACCQ